MSDRIQYGDVSETQLADAIGDQIAGQAITGVWMTGKTVEGTTMYANDGKTYLDIMFTDGTAMRIAGQFDVGVRDKQQEQDRILRPNQELTEGGDT